MKYLYTELDHDLNVLAQAINWWRNLCVPIVVASNGRWEETPRVLSVNDIEINFSNPVYELRSVDGKKAVYIAQVPPPEVDEPPVISVLFRSGFKGYKDVNDGQGIAILSLACPICHTTVEIAQQILWAWIADERCPEQIVELTERIYPPSKGNALIDL